MAKNYIAQKRVADKPTFIYGLVDPRTQQLRYVGKTILRPERRLSSHICNATKRRPQTWVATWIRALVALDLAPEIFVLEEVAAGADWIEAEQFWISYFRFVGCNLTNLTLGGDGQPGFKQSPETIARRIKSGPSHHRYGISPTEEQKAAIGRSNAKLWSNPEWAAWSASRRRAGQTPEVLASNAAKLRDILARPGVREKAAKTMSARLSTPDGRARMSAQSKNNWAVNREKTIAASRAAMGDEWRKKQSESQKRAWRDPNSKQRAGNRAKRKLSNDQVAEIKRLSDTGLNRETVAAMFGISGSWVSAINRDDAYGD